MAIVSLLNLTEADKLSGSEVIPVNQCGTTKRLPVSAISGGGENSVTNGEQAIVLAGFNNRALSSFGVVVQGENNYTFSGPKNTILNGNNNCNLSNGYSTIIGGVNNLIAGCDANTERSIILNGCNNSLSASRNSIIGGDNSKINTPKGCNNAILVGNSACITSDGTFCKNNVILTGNGKLIDTCQSTILNGVTTCIKKSNHSILGTGFLTCILSSSCSFIASAPLSKIVSGSSNSILGGTNNYILSGSKGAILGGQCNCLNGNNSFIIGSDINGFADGTTFVNKLSATNSIHAGNGFTGTITISSNTGDKSMVITDGIITGLS